MNQRITINTPIQHQAMLPEKTDVVIIGGGVIGVFTALYLVEQGKSVCLLEKGRIAGEQSSRNWGWIRQHGRDEAEIPLVRDALSLWQQVDEETKGACGFQVCGVSYLASSHKEQERLEEWLTIAGRNDLSSHALTADQVKDLYGGASNGQWVGGTTTPDDARAEPWQAVPAVAQLAVQKGAAIRENCAVRALDIQAGQLRGVITEDGAIACEQVVLAAGAWSSLFARAHGVEIPQLAVKSTVVQSNPLPDFTQGNSADEHLAIRRRQDGSYTLAVGDHHDFYIGPDAFRHLVGYIPLLGQAWRHTRLHPMAPKTYPDGWFTPRHWQTDREGPFEACRVLEPTPSQSVIRNVIKRYKDRFPKGGDIKVQDAWAGMIDAMPDAVPIIDNVTSIPGLIIATGMSGHGFGIGPGVAKAICSLLKGENQVHDLSRFRLSRFTDGSPIVMGPSL